MSILIVGATGRVGSETALTLARKGLSVSALVRGGKSHPGSRQLLDAGVFVVHGDLRRHESLREAVKGIEMVICSATALPAAGADALQRVDHDGTLALIEAAEATGVKRFIYVSYSGNIRWESPLEYAKRECENRLLHSTLEAVILRPSFFMEAWLSPMAGFDPAIGSVRIYGHGDSKVSYISSSNVADFAVECATRELEQKTTILELGGPDALSQLEAVGIFEQKLKREMTGECIPFEALRIQYESSDPFQKTVAALMLAYAGGDVVQNAIQTAQKYGVRLRSVFQYAHDLHPQRAVA